MSKILYWLLFLGLTPQIALAQITPDASLGDESSVVETKGDRDTIKGGAVRNNNLLHSFQEFNIETGKEAYFANPNGIDNIFSRVTGNGSSNINGVLGVSGNANLYLINPNGIIFGRNARLDVNGSFFATTADSILFDSGAEFSSANPNTPPLLIVDIPIGLRFRDRPGDITNQANKEINTSVENTPIYSIRGLEVDRGENITFVGGNIFLEKGRIIAPGGNVELGGLLASGIVTINPDGSLSFPEGIAKGNVSISDSAKVNVRGDSGGLIAVNANNLTIKGAGSELVAGIDRDSGFPEAVAGDILINANNIVLENSTIANQVLENARGDAGNIIISTIYFDATNSFIITEHKGKEAGNAGNIDIESSDSINFKGLLLLSTLGKGVTGKAGNVTLISPNIKFTTLKLEDSEKKSQIIANATGIGNAGNITIKSEESFILENNSQLLSKVDSGAKGNSGFINIESSIIQIDNSAINVNTEGIGNAGRINIIANDFLIVKNSSNLFAQARITAEGNSGVINIEASTISLNESTISNNIDGIGDGGLLAFKATDSFVINNSTISSKIKENSIGDAGNIIIEANSLIMDSDDLNKKSSIVSDTEGKGNGGDISLKIKDTLSLRQNSAIVSGVKDNAEGDAGNITIDSPQILLDKNSAFSSGTSGQGLAGNIIIDTNFLSLNNFSDISSTTRKNSTAKGGTIVINADFGKVIVENESRINAFTTSIFNGGEIKITANNLELNQGGKIFTGSINKDNPEQDENLENTGSAGNIQLNIRKNIIVDGSDSPPIISDPQVIRFKNLEGKTGLFAFTTSNSQGDGGNITIGIFKTENNNWVLDESQFTDRVTLKNDAEIAVDSQGKGKGGTININTQDLNLDRGNISATTTSKISAIDPAQESELSSIKLFIDDNLTLRNNSLISAEAKNNADGGNVSIRSDFIIAFPSQGMGSDIRANADRGTGGSIEIETNQIFGLTEKANTAGIENNSNDLDASSEFGLSGDIAVTKLEVDPNRNYLEVTPEIIDASQIITQNVCQQTRNSKFVDIGKGGFPFNPQNTLTGTNIDIGLVAPVTASKEVAINAPARVDNTSIKERTPPALGWIQQDNGTIELVAYNPEKLGEQRLNSDLEEIRYAVRKPCQ